MSEFEIILFAAIAVFFGYKLWSVLGKTNGNEKARAAETASLAEKRLAAAAQPKTLDLKSEKIEPVEVVPAHLEEDVKKIKNLDKSFSLKAFKASAEDNFESVIKNFSHKKSDELKKLMTGEVFKNFESEIKDHEARGLETHSTLISVAEPQILGIEVTGGIAHILVKFLSEQVHIVKNKAGEIVEGAANHIDHVADIWTFERDFNSKKSAWVIAGIQSE